jgi:TonB family protein
MHLCPLALMLAACATEPPVPPPSLRPDIPGSTRIEMPEALGAPVVVLAPELPAGVIAVGERAQFDIGFRINLRGEVVESRIESTTRPDLADAMLAQHRQWIYAVATREDPCRLRRFRGAQAIEVQRLEGKLVASSEPARVLEVLEVRVTPRINSGNALQIPNYRQVLGSIAYPRQAMVEGAQARFALLVTFDTDGSVKDIFPVNAAYDRYGFAQNAMNAARRLKADPAPSQAVMACIPIDFLLR